MSLQTAPRLSWKRERDTYTEEDGEREHKHTNTYGAALGGIEKRKMEKEIYKDNIAPSLQIQVVTQGER